MDTLKNAVEVVRLTWAEDVAITMNVTKAIAVKVTIIMATTII